MPCPDAEALARLSKGRSAPVAEASSGDLVITEFMADPDAVPDRDGEYVELYNRTQSAIDLEGFTFTDATGNVDEVETSVVVESGGFAVLARRGDPSENGGIEADYGFDGDFSLNNPGDTAWVRAPSGEEVAVLAYEEGHVVAGTAQEIVHIERGFDGFTEGDDYDLAGSTFGDGDYGSPGETGSTVLPVELIAFKATLDGREALLKWETASEKDNAGFEVQQKIEGTFERIGYVEGAGTTEEAQSYSFRTDELDLGTQVFRLKQIDYDGTTSYSEEVEVRVALAGTYELSEPYPNPASGAAQFELAVGEAQEVRAELYDALGRRVATLFSGRMEAGRSEAITVEAEGLSNGLYFVRVEGEGFEENRRLILVR